jgi:hypothetical protein
MKTIINKYKFDCIWHFTDKSNIDLIKKHNGLLSFGELERRGIEIPISGGNDWSHDADKTKGVHEYVHLAFVDDHPMLYRAKKEGRIPNPIWLKIKSSILLQEGVRFCSDVSNKSGVAILPADKAKNQIDFDVLFTYLDWRDAKIQTRKKAALKSEILIPEFVSIDNILGFKNG